MLLLLLLSSCLDDDDVDISSLVVSSSPSSYALSHRYTLSTINSTSLPPSSCTQQLTMVACIEHASILGAAKPPSSLWRICCTD